MSGTCPTRWINTICFVAAACLVLVAPAPCQQHNQIPLWPLAAPLRYRPQRYKCPHCKWGFARRKKRCCPGCGTLLLIVSDMLSDAELTELRSSWMRVPLKEKWDFIRDWEEHKVEVRQRFEEYVFGRGGGLGQEEKRHLPLTRWLQSRRATAWRPIPAPPGATHTARAGIRPCSGLPARPALTVPPNLPERIEVVASLPPPRSLGTEYTRSYLALLTSLGKGNDASGDRD
jgi:hypothetical protein